MGRVLLIALPLAWTVACARPGPPTRTAATDTGGQGNPHADLACAACHNGAQAALGLPTVPRNACTASGCHADAGPEEVSIGTVRFRHRDHGLDGAIKPSCAGCHSHASGEAPLRASVDACALCHITQVSGQNPADCKLCHQHPDHVELTSQAVPIPHSTLPWVETGCVRCHYDVAAAPVRVPTRRCANCHTQIQEVTAAGIGEDLHPQHAGVMCTACHESGLHRVRAMSSAVDLVCTDCHVRAHHLDLQESGVRSDTCDRCHGKVHQAQQRLLLGILPGMVASPSAKFIAGITCRSCHIPPAAGGRPGQDPIRGTAQACAGCHPSQYKEVLAWWLDGVKNRERVASAYTAAAARALAGSRNDSIQSLLTSAQAMLQLVARAGGQHNLELSDRIFRESMDRAALAYRLAGRTAPPRPDLGPAAHAGLCTYCHYSPNDPWDFQRMSSAFHRSVLKTETER